MKSFITTALLMASIFTIAMSFYKGYQLKQEFSGYLRQSAASNSPQLALQTLERSVNYLENHGLTSGNTSAFIEVPENDLGFFYSNLKQSRDELKTITDSTSSMEKSNVLLKLRETLITHGEKGDRVQMPDNLAFYPNQALWKVLFWAAIIYIFGILSYYLPSRD